MEETTPTVDPKRRYLCRHVHTKGTRCGSPALRGRDFCYYHDRSRREVEVSLSNRAGIFSMPRVDDRASIQIALSEVLARLACGDIDYRRGSIILYGLQIASSNLRDPKVPAEAAADPVVEDIITDYHRGDLAPIAEIPETVPTEATPQDAPSPDTAAARPQLVHCISA